MQIGVKNQIFEYSELISTKLCKYFELFIIFSRKHEDFLKLRAEKYLKKIVYR